MNAILKNKAKLLLLLFSVVLASCAHEPTYPERTPAGFGDLCLSAIQHLINLPAKVHNEVEKIPVPELTQLNPEIKRFPNGRKYIQYQANLNVMNKYPDYEEFLEETAEIIFSPKGPFGHTNLRLGKKVYSFDNINATSVAEFIPEMIKSTKEDTPSSHGFVFYIGKEKIQKVEQEITKLYESSGKYNIPPFDAYSPKVKIVEKDHLYFWKTLAYESDSPKFANNEKLKGSIVEESGKYFLVSKGGFKVSLTKEGDEFYTQSYSCSTSAVHILKSYFNLDINNGVSSKHLVDSLLRGNDRGKVSPFAVIKYYEEP